MHNMEQMSNAVLIQGVTISEIESIVCRVVDARMKAFYDSIRQKPPVLIPRQKVAQMLGLSLPTIDKYGRFGILHPRHVGGRVFYEEDEIEKFKQNNT